MKRKKNEKKKQIGNTRKKVEKQAKRNVFFLSQFHVIVCAIIQLPMKISIFTVNRAQECGNLDVKHAKRKSKPLNSFRDKKKITSSCFP